MKKAITLVIAMVMGTACMASMDDESLTETDEATLEKGDVGEASQGARKSFSPGGVTAAWRDGEPCTVDDDGTKRHGEWSGDFCCYDTGRGTEMCLNCFFYSCESGHNVLGGGGFGSPPIVQTPF